MLIGIASTLHAQELKPAVAPAIAHVTFAFERKGVQVPKYKLTLNSDGTGTYEGQEVRYVTVGGTSVANGSQDFNRQISISHATADKVFKLAGQLDHFNKPCASKAKNIADTGTKILTYEGPDGTGSCTYNYADNKDVQALTNIMLGITETLDQGRQLDHLHRYDRLGLDSAIAFLAQEVSEGRALEVGTIEPSLRSIATDAAVMARVRSKASSLLMLIPDNSMR
jgi:hypothetical protein